MMTVVRLVAAWLLACAIAPPLAFSGGYAGEEPYDIGQKLLAKKHYKTALSYFQKALKRNDVRAHYGMGLLYETTGKGKDALGQYQRFIDGAQPEDALRSDAVRRAGAIEERMKSTAARTTELLERGIALFKQGKYREAEKALLQAAEGGGKQAEAHFYLGEVYLQLENYDKAELHYHEAKRSY